MSPSTRDQFRDKSATEAVVATFKGTCTWDTPSRRIASVQRHSQSSTERKDAMRESKVFLKGIIRPMLLAILRFCFTTSPAMKGCVVRTTKRTAAGKIEHQIDFTKDLLVELAHDKLGWILVQLAKEKGSLEGLDDITLIIELRRLVENGNVFSVHIASSVYKSIADLALYAEIWIQCRAYAPAIFHHMSVADQGIESMDTRRAITD